MKATIALDRQPAVFTYDYIIKNPGVWKPVTMSEWRLVTLYDEAEDSGLMFIVNELTKELKMCPMPHCWKEHEFTRYSDSVTLNLPWR